jgi:putative radical SAM enzyme (TIGR03279 family)
MVKHRKSEERMPGHRIREVVPGSIADELGVAAGDRLLSVNNRPIADVMDYEQLCSGTVLELRFEGEGGEYWADVEKDEAERLGLVFDTPLMSPQRSCANRCVFCFVDQLPPGLRPSLYFKDDDWRLSMMTGNYITLTNVGESEFARILRLRAGPLYISVHTTDQHVRGFMLGQEGGAPVMERLRALRRANIPFHMQIVVCPGVNDGQVLDETLFDLETLRPYARSVAVVPVGLTRFREGLYPLRPFTADEARKVIGLVEARQERCRAETGGSFAFLADEFYLKAGRPLPPAAHYEDFAQLENGVGMIAWLYRSFGESSCKANENASAPRLSVATGVLAAPVIEELAGRINPNAAVYAVKNRFFGENITVAGLVTGGDVIAQLKGRDLGDRLLIPESMLRCGEPVFLDGVTPGEVQAALGVPVRAVGTDSLCAGLLGIGDN